MNRVEELTLRLIDGDLTDAELVELERLVRDDPAAAERHVALIDLEAQMRSEERDPGLAARTMERLRASTALKRDVMARIRSRAPRRRAWGWIAAAGLLLGATAVVLLLPGRAPENVAVQTAPKPPRIPEKREAPPVVVPDPTPPVPEPPRDLPLPRPDPVLPKKPEPVPAPLPVPVPAPDPPKPAAPERTIPAVATLAGFEGDVYVLSGTDRQRGKPGQPLLEGHAVQSVGGLSFARVAYPDGTSLELGGQTYVRDLAAGAAAVECGTVTAEIPKSGKAMVLRTPQGEARGFDAQLRLLVAPEAAAGWTRLDVLGGKATLAREGRTVEIPAGGFAVAAAGVSLAVSRAPQGFPPPDPRRVDEAIRKGVAYLKAARAGQQAVSGVDRPMNTDELEVWTFLHAGVPENDPKFQEDLEKVLKAPLERTYKVALRAMILEELDRVKHQERIAQCAQFLIDNQCKDGQWSYGEPSEFADGISVPPHVASVDKAKEFVPTPPGRGRIKPKPAKTVLLRRRKDGPATGDLSNSQYAALGLRACAEAGIAIPQDVLLRAMNSWAQAQHAEPKRAPAVSGWCYDEDADHAPYGSMTAGAVGALVIYDRLLGRNGWKRDAATQAGLAWLAKYFTVDENPAAPGSAPNSRAARGSFYYYYLYALERVGGLCGLDRFGVHEWYPLGAKAILDAQRADGSWAHASKYSQPQWETCFAILFLRRPTSGVASIDRVLPGK